MNTKIIEQPASPSQLALIYRPIDVLQLDEKNARQHSPRQIAQIVRSIQSFNFNVPILIDKNNKVLAGHGRVLACLKMGWREVPTIQLEHLWDRFIAVSTSLSLFLNTEESLIQITYS